MKLSLHEIDDQIRDVENRIAVERIALDDAVHGCASSLREAATSPKTLLAVLGVGYTVGKILFRDKQKSQPQQAVPRDRAMLRRWDGLALTFLRARVFLDRFVLELALVAFRIGLPLLARFDDALARFLQAFELRVAFQLIAALQRFFACRLRFGDLA